ncbi:MAG: tetratricopeptide repeat protein, partial [Planctomycetota bacterium]
LNRASCHARMGHFTDALGDVRRAMDLQPRDAAVWHTRGMIYREQGDLPAALADFNESLRIDPDSANTLNVRGGVLLDMNQVDDALRDFNRAISLNSCDGFYNRARVRNRLNDLAGAMSDYADCIAREPWQSGAWNNRGLLRRKTGDLPGAIADFRQALRCAPDKWDAKANLGHTLAHTGVPSDRTEGVQLLQDAWRMCPDSAARTRIATLIRDAGGDVPE